VSLLRFLQDHARALGVDADEDARATAVEVLAASVADWQGGHEEDPTRYAVHAATIARWCRAAGLQVPPWVVELLSEPRPPAAGPSLRQEVS